MGKLLHTLIPPVLAVVLHASAALAAEDVSRYAADAVAARSYAEAYSTRDLAKIRALLAEDAEFVDASNHFIGREEIIKGLGEAFGKITGSGPDNREIVKFRSGNDFVFVAFIDFNMLMEAGDLAEREYNFKLKFAMVLKVENGKILRHVDYVDTDTFVAQLQSQIKPDPGE